VRLHSRPLTRYFPEIVAAIADRFTGDVVLDGVIWGVGTRVSTKSPTGG